MFLTSYDIANDLCPVIPFFFVENTIMQVYLKDGRKIFSNYSVLIDPNEYGEVPPLPWAGYTQSILDLTHYKMLWIIINS